MLAYKNCINNYNYSNYNHSNYNYEYESEV